MLPGVEPESTYALPVFHRRYNLGRLIVTADEKIAPVHETVPAKPVQIVAKASTASQLRSIIKTTAPPHIHTIARAIAPAQVHTIARAIAPAQVHTIARAVAPAQVHTIARAVAPAQVHTIARAVSHLHVNKVIPSVEPPPIIVERPVHNESTEAVSPFHENTKALFTSAPIVSKIENTDDRSIAQHELQAKESNDLAFSTRASWYGPGFEGRRTASGERFNSSGLTAASRTLRLGSKVLVANPNTGRCCTVTINDRGPYVGGRDIDLSRGAAARIGVTGVSPVICVAYAEPPERYRSGKRSRHTASVPPRITGKVMHLIASAPDS